MAEARQIGSKTSAARSSESGAGAEATKKLPVPENPLVIRTDFSDQAAWEALMTAIKTPTPEFKAYVEFLDDPAFRGLTSAQLLGMVSSEYKAQHSFLMIVDERTIAEPEHPLVLVNLVEDEADGDDGDAEEPQYGREFRAVPSAIQAVENNLSIDNMDFEDFADAVDKDGVFRGFRDAAE